MKIKIMILAVMSFLVVNPAFSEINYDFSGSWQGNGKIQDGGSLEMIDAQFDIKIQRSESAISINECWSIPDAELGGVKTSCYKNEFSTNEYDQIFEDGNKIGDIFPSYIMTFRSNSQVSELMKFVMDRDGVLKFQYNYSNYDGNMTFHLAQLTRNSLKN